MNKKYDNLQNNNLNNFRYYCDYKKNNIDNNRNIQKSYSLDNFNISKGFRASTPCNRKNNNLTDDFNYEQFKLKVKLGLLKKQIYNKEMRNININKNELNNNLYLQDKTYIENALNRSKKKLTVENILLEKTKKILEEKKLKKDKKIKDRSNYLLEDKNQILYSIKKNLVENNRNNNKYIINPKIYFFKS